MDVVQRRAWVGGMVVVEGGCGGQSGHITVSACVHACTRVQAARLHHCVCVCMHACAQSLSRVRLCDPMDYSLPGSSVMGFPREEYWSGLPFHPPGDLLDPGIEPVCPALVGKFFTTAPPGKPWISQNCDLNDSQGSQVESYRLKRD